MSMCLQKSPHFCSSSEKRGSKAYQIHASQWATKAKADMRRIKTAAPYSEYRSVRVIYLEYIWILRYISLQERGQNIRNGNEAESDNPTITIIITITIESTYFSGPPNKPEKTGSL